ncbi:MAG: hypothetical protein VKM92_08845 [Cyanobacteriota bacterium]|nr:hypothetical protein [Cyanobacteriota bacterium]
MVQAVRPVDAIARLVEQLNALSQLTESLAFRMVELEERLAASELRIQPLLDAGIAAAHSDHTELRLGDTEERIARLESLLRGAVHGALHEPLEDPDPFIDEGEQPFMDELAA